MTVSLRGGAPRRPKRLPATLVHRPTRHELPPDLANRSLTDALATIHDYRTCSCRRCRIVRGRDAAGLNPGIPDG